MGKDERVNAPTQLSKNSGINVSSQTATVQGKFTGNLESENAEAVLNALIARYDGIKKLHRGYVQKLIDNDEESFSNLEEVAAGLIKNGLMLKEKVTKAPIVLKFGKSRIFDEASLSKRISELYANKKLDPSIQDLLETIRAEYTEEDIDTIVESKEFVYAFQKIVRLNTMKLAVRKLLTGQEDTESKKTIELIKKSHHTELNDKSALEGLQEYQLRDIGKWTLRHYSAKGSDEVAPPFTSVKSAISLGIKDTKPAGSGGHTNKRDWNRYGNTGSTFFLLYIDGKVVQKQKFLDNAKWFTETPLQDIPSLWVSSDWLDEEGIKGPALRGSGRQIQQALLKLGGKEGVDKFIPKLESMFHNFEVKVPGTVPVKKWQKADGQAQVATQSNVPQINITPLPNPWLKNSGTHPVEQLDPVSQFRHNINSYIAKNATNMAALHDLLILLNKEQRRSLRQSYQEDIELGLGYQGRVEEKVQKVVIQIIDSIEAELLRGHHKATNIGSCVFIIIRNV